MQPHLINLITSKGRITIPLNIFLSFGGITDINLLLEYERLLKSKNNFAFTSLISLTWDKTPRGVKLKLNFDLDVSEIHLRQLLDYLETPAPQILDEADDGINDQPPVGEVVDEADDGIDDQPPVAGGNLPRIIRKRKSKKTEYTLKTLNKYSSEIEREIWSLIDNKLVTLNDKLRKQVTKEIFTRMNKKIYNTMNNTDDDESRVVTCSIRTLIEKMNKHGVNDREQIRFMSGIALAVCGGRLSVAKLQSITGLSRRIIRQGNTMRVEFDSESEAAKVQEAAALLNPEPEDVIIEEDVDLLEHESESESESESDNDEVPVAAIPGKKVRANRGEGLRRNRNRYRVHFSCKKRKTRSDVITGVEVQRFCHESQWGGRVDTLKLSKMQVIIEQPLGGFEYESVRSYQYSVTEMYTEFKKSEYGIRQRNANMNKDLSEKRFRELICPCMTHCKQRDTADEIVAEFKHCLVTWDTNMRKKDKNVRASIERCKLTECKQHKKDSATAILYSNASKSPVNFLKYLLCPMIQRDELAVKVMTSPSTYQNEVSLVRAANLDSAMRLKISKDLDFMASGARRG